METIDGIEYLYTEDVALQLGVSTSRVRQLLISGNIIAERVGDRYRGYWLITQAQVDNFKGVRKGPGRPRK